MKKILLSLGLFALVLVGKSQTVFNEFYTDPGNNKEEFFELYNTSTNPVPENLNCYTLITWYKDGSTTGFYVLDFPNLSVASKSFFVAAASDPFDVQSKTNVDANFSWNAFPDATGSLKNYTRNGSGYTVSNVPANFNDLFHTNTGTPAAYAMFLFKDGVYINGFLGGHNSSTVPTDITGMPALNVDMDAACGDFQVDWSSITLAENTTANGGSDNGFIRDRDGKCGSWVKSSSQVQHTPGATNGSAVGLTGALVTSEVFLGCPTSVGEPRVVTFDVTGFTGDANEANSFDVEVQLYFNNAPLNSFGPEDTYQRSVIQENLSDGNDTFRVFPQDQSIILVYKTVLGCFDKVVSIVNQCSPLPVNLKTFTAARNRSTVLLKWETTTEINNSGFAIERNTKGVWEEIAFVPSQAPGGNSGDLLGYSYSDLNDLRGISQYRLRQIDLDSRSKYSAIRAVRGEGQSGSTVVFPNPSSDGRVNVVFEETNVTREISLFDMSGRAIKQWKNVTNNNIQIENLTPGVYSLRIFAPATGEQSVEKIVVNKR